MGRLPNFLIIGAQKAGTSWLNQKLCQHPRIFLPKTKDQAFFCWCDKPDALTLEQYREGFEPGPDEIAVGEATAAYFWTGSGSHWDIKPDGYCADIPKRVADTLGRGTRLILSLRDPVDRTVSAYLHHIAMGDLDPGVSLLDAGDFSGLIDIGFYAAHLRNWLRYFPLEQFLVLGYEQDIAKYHRETLRRVFGFLGVDPDWQVKDPEQVVFEGRARIWRDGGVWVPVNEYPTVPAHEQRQIEGHPYCRLVDSSTIAKLRKIYANDQAELQDLVF